MELYFSVKNKIFIKINKYFYIPIGIFFYVYTMVGNIYSYLICYGRCRIYMFCAVCDQL